MQWEEGSPNRPIARECHAFALDLQGTGSNQLTVLKTKLEQTKAKLEQFQTNPNDTTPIQNLTKEDLSGDLLYAGILGYFASVDGADTLAARSSKTIVNYRMPSYGDFSATAQPHVGRIGDRRKRLLYPMRHHTRADGVNFLNRRTIRSAFPLPALPALRTRE
ncbi:MAG TPA: hypothetical protein VI457_06925 [Methylococcaceae bacterium]|nr:hypothetical protein [Methylococcaceae bacterium]